MSNRIQQTADVLVELVEIKDCDVVDVGCGTGELVRWMRGTGARVKGVECAASALDLAIGADPHHSADYLDGVAQQLPLTDGSVDVVVFANSFHHVPIGAMPKAVIEARRVLRAGGTLVVVEPRPLGSEAEVGQLVLDEAEVQDRVQAVLDDASAVGLTESGRREFVRESEHVDFESWAQLAVGSDEDRERAFAEHRTEIERRFYRLAERRDGNYVLSQKKTARAFIAG